MTLFELMLLPAVLLLAALTWELAGRRVRGRVQRVAEAAASGAGMATGGTAAGGVPTGVTLDAELLFVLVAAALRAGAPVPRALDVVASGLTGRDALVLRRVATALEWGAGLPLAAAEAEGAVSTLVEVLGPAWEVGASPDGALRLWSEQRRRDRRAAARSSAAGLAVRLVVPLGMCFLPAFVLLGLVPLVMAFGVGQ